MLRRMQHTGWRAYTHPCSQVPERIIQLEQQKLGALERRCGPAGPRGWRFTHWNSHARRFGNTDAAFATLDRLVESLAAGAPARASKVAVLERTEQEARDLVAAAMEVEASLSSALQKGGAVLERVSVARRAPRCVACAHLAASRVRRSGSSRSRSRPSTVSCGTGGTTARETQTRRWTPFSRTPSPRWAPPPRQLSAQGRCALYLRRPWGVRRGSGPRPPTRGRRAPKPGGPRARPSALRDVRVVGLCRVECVSSRSQPTVYGRRAQRRRGQGSHVTTRARAAGSTPAKIRRQRS